MKLADYMKKHGMTASALARQIGTTAVAVIRYRNGLRRPSPKVMERIVRVTGGAVTPNDFYDLPPVSAAAGDERNAGDPLRRAGGGQG